MLLEVCVEDLAGLEAAIKGGADRIELCSALALGGLTPSRGMMEAAADAPVPVFVMVRPRAGDFIFSRDEMQAMEKDIRQVREAGLAGVVLGVSRCDSTLDETALRQLVLEATGLGKTLHRAIDLVPDIEQAVETAIELGFDRILTSGQMQTAEMGRLNIRRMVQRAGGRISIMPGSGINADTAETVLRDLAVTEVHASCAQTAEDSDPRLAQLGFSQAGGRKVSEGAVRALKTILQKEAA